MGNRRCPCPTYRGGAINRNRTPRAAVHARERSAKTERNPRMNARTIGGVLVLILLVGVVMYTRLGEAGDSGEAAKADVMVLVAEIEGL